MKLYLSGPMTGLPRSNYPAFEAAANDLRYEGHEVFSPHEFLPEGKPSRVDLRRAFAEYSRFICEEADAVILLPGWQASKGAAAEVALAQNCGLQIFAIGDTEPLTSFGAAQDVVAERFRQVSQEGWSVAHDDAHADGQLAAAAGCYALHAHEVSPRRLVPAWWPWEDRWWKPSDARRNLVKAGALILAEIERLDRVKA